MMALMSGPRKRARVENDDAKYRKGVTWRSKPGGVSRRWLVEMRFPKKLADMKVGFGSYNTQQEAMMARDYVAFLRNSTGKEHPFTVGGFYQRDDSTDIFEFEESRTIFDGLHLSKARCDEYKCLLALISQKAPNSLKARKAFVENAKWDIRLAIESFRSTYPEKFGRGFDARGLPMTNPVDQASSSSLFMVPPTAGCNVGDGSTATKIEVSITVQGSAPKKLLFMEVPGLSTEEILCAAFDNLGIDKFRQALTKKIRLNQQVGQMLADRSPCPVDPNDVPPLESSTLSAISQLQDYGAENQYGGCCNDCILNPNFSGLGRVCFACDPAEHSALPIL